MPKGVVEGSWTLCLKARVEGGREAPQAQRREFRPTELCSTPVSPKAKVRLALTVTRRKGGGRCQDPHV